MVREALRGFLSGGTWLWVLAGALSIVALVLLVQVIRAVAARAAKRKLAAALEQTGLVVTDERPRPSPGVSTGEQEQLLHQAQELTDYEKRLREKEELLHQQIERLYQQAQQLAKKQHQLAKRERKQPANASNEVVVQVIPETDGLSADARRVLLLTDELLEKLPDDAIQKFVSSPDFELYRKVLKQAKGGRARGAP